MKPLLFIQSCPVNSLCRPNLLRRSSYVWPPALPVKTPLRQLVTLPLKMGGSHLAPPKFSHGHSRTPCDPHLHPPNFRIIIVIIITTSTIIIHILDVFLFGLSSPLGNHLMVPRQGGLACLRKIEASFFHNTLKSWKTRPIRPMFAGGQF